ncbi:hypothetical protein [Streptomyces sp. NBC_00365]|uniref:hypothetical protein n=1 Tax=Streptomyces sp. NBC_00365 TaxID=2975726 RepID=UPI002B1D5956|nr:hypothetical protein [Streptomyces sp. NBC_00365]
MLLSEFLLTRVVEVAVHGLDLADALGREPVTREEALDAGRPDIRWLTLRRERRQRQLSRCGGASMVQVHIPYVPRRGQKGPLASGDAGQGGGRPGGPPSLGFSAAYRLDPRAYDPVATAVGPT